MIIICLPLLSCVHQVSRAKRNNKRCQDFSKKKKCQVRRRRDHDRLFALEEQLRSVGSFRDGYHGTCSASCCALHADHVKSVALFLKRDTRR
jgi:hypothetical protein